MADEKVGGIYYEVGADTSELDAAQARVSSSSNKMASSLDKTSAASARLDTQQKKLAVGVGKANAAMGDFGRKAGMAGIQIQQLVGQVAAGTNPMAALSMQAADLGFVLGFPLAGAIAGIVAAIGGPFITSLFNAGKASDEFNDKIKDTIQNLDSTQRKITEGAYKELARQIDETKNKIDELESSDANRARGITARRSLQKKQNEELSQLREKLATDQEALIELERELNKTETERREDLNKLVDSIVAEGEAAGKTRLQLIEMHRAEALAAAAAMGADEAQRKAINSAFDRIAAEEKKAEAIKQAAEEDRKAEADARKQEGIQNRLQQVKAGLDAEYAAYLTFHQQVEAINDAFNAGIVSSVQERDALIAASAARLKDTQVRISGKANEEAVNFQNAWNNAITRVDDVGADAFTDTFLATRDAGMAVQDLAKSIGRELVSALIKYAVQWSIQQAMQLAGITTLTAANAAGAVATASAWAPAAAAVSLATMGANAGPAAAGITSAYGLTQALSAPGRATGGVVSSGNLYKINEHGAGEFFNDPMGGQYFMPSSNGSVSTSGGGSGVNIMFNITQEAGAGQLTVTGTQQNGDQVIINGAIRAVASQIASGTGEVSTALRGQGFQGRTRR